MEGLRVGHERPSLFTLERRSNESEKLPRFPKNPTGSTLMKRTDLLRDGRTEEYSPAIAFVSFGPNVKPRTGMELPSVVDGTIVGEPGVNLIIGYRSNWDPPGSEVMNNDGGFASNAIQLLWGLVTLVDPGLR